MTGQPRHLAWNLALVGFEGCLIGWAHFIVGVSWAALGTGLAAVLAFGIALITYVVKVHTPRTIRRHHALLQSYQAAATEERHQIQEGASARHEDVDGQSTPHLASPSLTAQLTNRASRAR
jgi:hypothetical protein